MKRIMMLGMAFVVVLLSLNGCMKSTGGDVSRGERSDMQQSGERGGGGTGGGSSSGFGGR